MDGLAEFHTCPLVELGFLRVSMEPAFRVAFADAVRVLADIKGRAGAKLMADDFDTAGLPSLVSHAEVTDAYLVELARSKGLRLATLDEALCEMAWAAGIAFVPFPKVASPAAQSLSCFEGVMSLKHQRCEPCQPRATPWVWIEKGQSPEGARQDEAALSGL